MRTREEYEAEVRRPGPFEGENPWVAYFYEKGTDNRFYYGPPGEEKEDAEEYVYIATVTAADAEMWPELAVGERIAWMEVDDGICGCSVPTFTDDDGL
jgi:hypothetical protein